MASTSLRSGGITVNGKISIVDKFLCIVKARNGVTCVSMWNVHCTIMSREQLKLLWAFMKYYPRKNVHLYGNLYASIYMCTVAQCCVYYCCLVTSSCTLNQELINRFEALISF